MIASNPGNLTPRPRAWQPLPPPAAQPYVAIMLANLPCPDMAGYQQWVDVFCDGKWVAGRTFAANPGQPCGLVYRYEILGRQITATNCAEALARFLDLPEAKAARAAATGEITGPAAGPAVRHERPKDREAFTRI